MICFDLASTRLLYIASEVEGRLSWNKGFKTHKCLCFSQKTIENTRVAASLKSSSHPQREETLISFFSFFFKGCLSLFNPPFLCSQGICGISCQPASPVQQRLVHHCQNDSDQKKAVVKGGVQNGVWFESLVSSVWCKHSSSHLSSCHCGILGYFKSYCPIHLIQTTVQKTRTTC